MVATLLLLLFIGPNGTGPADAQENPFAIHEGIKQFLDKNINRGAEPLQELQNLVDLVFEKNALHFGYQPVTRTASETFDNHGGNCVSFAFLLIGMSRYLGLDARFRETDMDPLWSLSGAIPRLDGHVDVAVRIGAQEYIVDLLPTVNAIRIGGRTVSDQRAIAHFWNNRGAERLGVNDYEEAMACFRKALESDPKASFVWANIGATQSILGNEEEAVRSYKQALRISKNDLVAMSNLSALYERNGRIEDARQYQAKIRTFEEKNPYYHFALGLQDYQSGHYAESVNQLRIASKLHPTDPNFYLAMARGYARLGDLKRAGQTIELALKHAPDEASKARYNRKLEWLAEQATRR
jgi:tetratricopeptide (TPR) repeat protein